MTVFYLASHLVKVGKGDYKFKYSARQFKHYSLPSDVQNKNVETEFEVLENRKTDGKQTREETLAS